MKYIFFLVTCFSLHTEECTSSFFLRINEEQMKEVYGSDQKVYRDGSERVVQNLIEKMQYENSRKFFSTHLPWIGEERAKLAYKCCSNNAHLFGVSRERSFYRDQGLFTLLSGPHYQKSGQDFICSLERFLVEEGLDFSGEKLFPFQEIERRVGRSKMSLHFYRPSDISFLEKELGEIFKKYDPFCLSFPIGSDEETQAFRLLEQNEISNVISSIRYLEKVSCFNQSENTNYLLFKNFLNINGEEVPLSKILLWVEIDQRTGRVLEISPPLVLHQETQFLPIMLEEIDRVVNEILLGSFDQIGYFRFLFSHCCPFVRGSAAVGEWFETAFYRYLGNENFSQTSATTIDLEVLSSLSLEEFLNKYRSLLDE